MPWLAAACTAPTPPANAAIGLPQVLDRRRAKPDWLGEVRGTDGSFRETLTAPYPIARLVQQRFTAGLEQRGELALDAAPTLGLRLTLHRFEIVAVTDLAAFADIDMRLYDLASGRERDRQPLQNATAVALDPATPIAAQAQTLALGFLATLARNALDAPQFRDVMQPPRVG
ncbi:MAG: hypothetical protein LGL72_13590 [Acidibrevibacterium sp.]|uniref:hypothetical protein n=1 Tax=Acidibrevibacterium fodinaquatile TaxID=1969806 RepID=UPI0023A8CC20|nr:hypothetical protein [Acidibrevibacterium fodinaquatile]MCA7120406.1 hypothetical protein [Acidibrevibacterium fodinaquatile]